MPRFISAASVFAAMRLWAASRFMCSTSEMSCVVAARRILPALSCMNSGPLRLTYSMICRRSMDFSQPEQVRLICSPISIPRFVCTTTFPPQVNSPRSGYLNSPMYLMNP